MEIREAVVGDVDEIWNIGKGVEEFDTTDEVVTFWPKYVLRDCVKSESDFVVVAEEGKIVGFVIANYNATFRKAVIENVFVDAEFRGSGVGKKLVDSVTEKLVGIGCEYICLLTESDNKDSIEFYKKIGFNRGIDCVWMDKVIGSGFSK